MTMRIISRRTLKEFTESLAGHKDHAAVKTASVTGFPESIPSELHPSPVTCFCPQSVWKPLLYGVGEDRPAY
ncbi:MAG: hypothetical protein QM636_02240, partial [Rhizobium sp.]